MHFNGDHSKLYVACGDDDVIDVIDVATLEVVDKLATGSSPETFAIDEKRRRIYVSNEEASSLSVIDMDQNITVHEVPTGAEPEGVFVTEDGREVYVTSEVGDLVHRVDAESGVVEEDVVVGTRPRRFAATPDGKELWVSTELSGEVYIIDRTKFSVAGKIEFLPPGMRKSDVTPSRSAHHKGWQDGIRHVGACRPCGGGRCRDSEGAGLHPCRKAVMGVGTGSRREDALCRQRLWR
jgi:YVTN family beta-propeller protein